VVQQGLSAGQAARPPEVLSPMRRQLAKKKKKEKKSLSLRLIPSSFDSKF
jgi:hypothetical protein